MAYVCDNKDKPLLCYNDKLVKEKIFSINFIDNQSFLASSKLNNKLPIDYLINNVEDKKNIIKSTNSKKS